MKLEKRVAILGSTGTVGRLALEVISSLGDGIRVVALAAGKNVPLLVDQIRTFRPQAVALGNAAAADELRHTLGGDGLEIFTGAEGLKKVASWPEADLVISAIVGFAGLAPTLAALESGKDVALANKEALVAGGHLVREAQSRGGGRIFPLDSEHAALNQCLNGCSAASVKRLILTASGGPFWRKGREAVARATPAEALAHPVWQMGPKITVDSATLMNKGLEVIEAHWLFDMPWEKIDVLIHPQSVVHSLVEMGDGSYLAQLAAADMRLPIQFALTFPERVPARFETKPLDLAAVGGLEFAPVDVEEFPCFALALAAGRAGAAHATAMNAANEVAVANFLAGKIPLPAIAEVIRATIESLEMNEATTYEEIAAVDGWARWRADEIAARFQDAWRR